MNPAQTNPARLLPLELWGDLEPPISWVKDHFFDQDSRSGYAQRPQELADERGVLAPPLEQVLARYCANCLVGWVIQVSEEARCRHAPDSPER